MPDLAAILADGPWVTLGLLGAWHGVNPGMGWLFAVALGLQRRSRRVVVSALVPIAVGHELSLVATTAIGAVLGAAIDPRYVHPVAAAVLVAFGVIKFVRPRLHPRWTSFRVSHIDLVWWSFLMASAHGAGLMVLPVLAGWSTTSLDFAASHDHAGPVALVLGDASLPTTVAIVRGVAAVSLHTLAMVLAMTTVAVLVYERLGVQVLRRAWVNVDQLWAIALVATGMVTFFT